MKKDKVIGLIGGMGPYASAYFYKLLLDKSSSDFGAKNNNDFPEIVIDSVPVPDFISDTRQLESAKKMLQLRVEKLTEFGCTTLGMVCNTGHLLYPELASKTPATFISIIEAVSQEVKMKDLKRVGLFATRTTLETQLYQQAFLDSEVEIVTPDTETINLHEEIIRSVVAQGKNDRFQSELTLKTEVFIKEHSLDGIILGCTELPLVFPKKKFENVIDSLDILANSILTDYYNQT